MWVIVQCLVVSDGRRVLGSERLLCGNHQGQPKPECLTTIQSGIREAIAPGERDCFEIGFAMAGTDAPGAR